ncbi:MULTISPECIES: NUDIX hydrolase [unclassified Rhizobium]|jgi:8-oxo-dGTP pyrophosphatase MutT (NUDIX family)|uniref:NUDIX hydrolase n=2 Tax=Pseudomonadota TaxID=1224 RepID=UPI0006491AF4|nr:MULTISPECIES: NUDIX hydrolase [unclassified Rhizobium]MBN8954266.1 NUDIX hydrolase [Rhizobium tropici]OJY70845.1 MAG: DNA mismatch repair protein MutT [Rhizobium sp. 60-20]RKD50800.1 8-oxo-dGTP pyrophosphatase MutT (NUDIX family) [Rhizobium sp. WW_1]
MTKKTYLRRLASEAEKLFAGRTIEQYAAICYRRCAGEKDVQILLITSRDSGRWVIPKGWPMAGKLPHQVAEREAWEEAGVKGKVRKKSFGYYTYLKSLDTGDTVPSVVQVHLLEVAGLDDRFPEQGQRQRQWFSPNEAAARVREPELKSLLRMVQAAVTPDR